MSNNLSEDGVDDISVWTTEHVVAWFRKIGLTKIEPSALRQHKITGNRLLEMTRSDLKQEPFNIDDENEIDHLLANVETLRNTQIKCYMQKFETNGNLNGISNGFHRVSPSPIQNGRSKHKKYSQTFQNGSYVNGDEFSVTMPLIQDDHPNPPHSSPTSILISDPFPPDKFKAFLAILYMLGGFVASVVMLQFVHERVPTMEEDKPLPDIFFDVVPSRVEWAFNVCEINGMVLTITAILILVFHKHKFIIARRTFFILGTLYFYRSITIWVTTLPVPGAHFKCAPKVHGKIGVMLGRATQLLTGGGLSVTGSHHLCGDYLFSGHTIILVSMYNCVHEYTPKRLWWFHWICWLLSASGILCILLAHDHYTIDVVIAYLLTTRLFWTYNTIANQTALREHSNTNLFTRLWWFPIIRYFEANCTGGQLPKQYVWPLPWPKLLKTHRRGSRGPIKGV